MSETKHSVHLQVTATFELSDGAEERVFSEKFAEAFPKHLDEVCSNAAINTLLKTGLSDDVVKWRCIVTAVNAFEPMKAALKRARKELLWSGDQHEGGEVLKFVVDQINDALRLAEGE